MRRPFNWAGGINSDLRARVICGRLSWTLCVAAALSGFTHPAKAEPSVSPQQAEVEQAVEEAIHLSGEGRHDEAAERLEAIIHEHPQAGNAWEHLAWIHRNQGNLARAREILEAWARLDPRGATALENLGSLAVAENRLVDAVHHYRDALEREPDRDDLRFRLGQLLRWTGHLPESIETLRALHERHPQDGEIRLEFARALLSNWEYREAAEIWSRILADAPDDREARLADAQAALHTGRARAAELSARRLLAGDPDNVEAWRILADAAQYDDRLEDAWPALDAWLRITQDPQERDYLHARRIALRGRMHDRNPERYPFSGVLDLARQYAATFPDLTYAQLGLAETLVRAGRYAEAHEHFLRILREDNQRNIRAARGLFETALAMRRHEEAAMWLEPIRAFNPRDPYLAVADARLHSARGNARAAQTALDRLTEAGTRGATAVLLYHSLTSSPYGPALQTNRFRDHIRALMLNGYRVLTPDDLHEHWDTTGPKAGLYPDGRVRREVILTFDDGLESAHRFGTSIALEYGVRLTQHIISGNVDRGDPYLSSWDDLRHYRDTGAWVFGSHLHFASDATPSGRNGRMVRPMATRVWLRGEDRLETESEYFIRVRSEYRISQERIREELGVPADFVAYPYGDIGHELISNVPEAVPVNLNHAGRYYEIGFIQTPMAHAVHGDHPLLYQRHEMDITASGQETVRYLLDRHPVFLAERTRYDLALADGRAARARTTLDRLERLGYPPAAIRELHDRMRRDMTRAFSAPDLAPRRDLIDPPRIGSRVGAEFEIFSNRLDARHILGRASASLLYSPHVEVEAHVGVGRYRQAAQTAGPRASVSDQRAGAGLVWVGQDRTVLAVGGGWRDLDGSARDGIALAWIEAHGRIVPALDLRVRFDRDGMDDAALLARGVTRSLYLGQIAWEPADAWQVDASAQLESIGDGNRRTSVRVAPVFLGPENSGWRFGGVYTLTTADREEPDYWTPESLHTLQGLLAHRWIGEFGMIDVSVQAGWGRERARAEEGGTETGSATSGRADWRPAGGLQGWWSTPFGDRFAGGADAGFHRSPGYDEVRARIHFHVRF